MRAITDKGGPILEAKLVGYATAGRAAVKRKRPGWVILTVDVLAVLTAVGLVHGINAIFFRPAPVETAAANEPKLMPLSTVPGANFARIPSAASMAELAREARTVVSGIPDDAVLFARAALFAESPHRAPRFTQTAALQPPTSFGGPAAVILPGGPFGNGGSSPAAPGGTPGGSSGGAPGGGGIGGTPGGTPGQPDPPPVAEPNPEPPQGPPAPPEPTLLVYVPTPQPVNPVVENVVAPSVDAVDDIVEEATGPPLDLTPRLGLGVDLGVAPRADGGSAIRVGLSASGNGSSGQWAGSTGSGSGSESETPSAGASSSDASGSGAGTGSGTSAAPATLTSSVTNTVTGTVNSTLSAVGGLLR